MRIIKITAARRHMRRGGVRVPRTIAEVEPQSSDVQAMENEEMGLACSAATEQDEGRSSCMLCGGLGERPVSLSARREDERRNRDHVALNDGTVAMTSTFDTVGDALMRMANNHTGKR